MGNTKSYKILFSIAVGNLILLSLVLLSIEGMLRIFNIPFKAEWIPTENAVAHFDEYLGWSYVPNLSKKLSCGSHVRQVYFNKNGIRVPNPDFQFDYQRPSVLFVGGSCTMGHGLSYEESFVGQFGAFNGMPYQMVNLGVQGYGSDQAFLILKKFLPKFNTKVVVYTFIDSHIKRNGVYDRRLLYPDGRFLGTKPLFALNRKNELYLSKKPILYKEYIHSYLFDFLKIKVGRKIGTFPPFPEELTKTIIREMNRYCIENKVHFVMLNLSRNERKYYNFKELNVPIIDTLEKIPNGWEEMKIPNDGHPNAEACNYVAHFLLHYFQHNKLLVIKVRENSDEKNY